MSGDDDKKRFADVVVPLWAMPIARALAHGIRADADDVVQGACLRAFRAVGGYSGGNARAWTLTIVRNTAFSWLAKNRRRTLVAVDDLEAVERARGFAGRNGAQANPATPETELIAKSDAARLEARDHGTAAAVSRNAGCCAISGPRLSRDRRKSPRCRSGP